MQRPLSLTFPLHGARLIEASAGTGKTFTLAALYLRLVLGHGDQRAFSRPLLPPEILVVTFTDAATEELRERIRDRLAQAARVFADPDHQNTDAILEPLLADYPEPQQRQHCAERLNAAAQWMDEAAIYTIHGFCNRMLKQHAFDSGSLFSLELQEDASEEQQQAARDYWRTVIGGFPVSAANALQAEKLGHPDALLKECRPLLGLEEADPDTLPDSVGQWLAGTGPQAEQADRTRRALETERDALRQWVVDGIHNKWLNGASYKADNLGKMFAAVDAFIGGETLDKNRLKELKKFSQSGLKLNKQHQDKQPDLACLAALERYFEARDDNPLPRTDLLAHAAAWIGRRVERMRRQTATMGFDDMLSRLHDALRGDNGERLAQVIRTQFPVALIDEFQDTDPTQYGIFSTLYADQPDTGWFMIGDPKQAIYAFRGADVFTYLKARQATEGRHYTLDKNFRSATAMVNAVNHLFEYSQGEFGDVFMMGNAIPFQPVAAEGRADTLVIDDNDTAGITLWVEDNDKAISSGVYRDQQAARCASQIAHLLNGADQGVTGFREQDGFTPLRPRDIAVLVRTGKEAAVIRHALIERGVRSVYLSDKDSVFQQPQAADVLLILQACASPESDTRVRSALACVTLAQPYAELEAVNQDEVRWEQRVDQFHQYRHQWQRQGVLPMLRGLLLDFDVPARLAQSLDGERALTNLLHLAELLQQAATQLDGEQALIRYLEDALDQDQQTSQDSILRLESDDDRVKVITIHKSKGLEYPVVYLPFICSYRAAEKRRPPLRYHQDGNLRVSLEPDDDITRVADQERLAEDLRLLYVALTRARHACTLGIAPYARTKSNHNQLQHSAVGRLLFGVHGIGNDQLTAALQPLADDVVRVMAAPDDTLETHTPTATALTLREPRRVRARQRTPWWIASYSALKQVHEDLPPADPRGDQLAEHDATVPAGPEPGPTTGIHAFPRGPLPGTLLHDLLEQAGRDGFATTLAHPEELDQRVANSLAARHWQAHENTVRAWWRRVLTTPLPLEHGRVALQQLTTVVPEMEFLFPARQVPVARLDQLIRTHIAPEVPRPRLEADTLNGMLKGFIDLVFEHDGRYYVLDYKSNWLGAESGAYTRQAMTDAILASRYEVQYALYLLALHRLLRTRLGDDYHPREHLGGALYVFLRGLESPDAGTVFERPPLALIDALDNLFMATGEDARDAS